MGQWLERKGNMNTKSFLFKMCSGLVASLFVLTLVLTGFSVYALRSLLYDQYGGKLTDAAEGVDHLMEIYEANALAHARVLAEDPQIVAALQSRDFQTMLAASAPLMKDGGLDYMVLTDPSGHALIRTHQPTKVPKADDSIASQQNVKEAMGGKAFVTLEEGKTVRLSVRAGAPVYDANHQLIGVVSTGYVVSKNEIAEMAKSMFGADMMAFLKGEMIATSLKGADGENLSEYEEKDEDLLQKVEGEGGKAVAPLSLAGKDYLAAYAPLKDADGNIIGMVAMANELSPITAAVLKTTLTSIAFSVLILVIATVGARVPLFPPYARADRRRAGAPAPPRGGRSHAAAARRHVRGRARPARARVQRDVGEARQGDKVGQRPGGLRGGVLRCSARELDADGRCHHADRGVDRQGRRGCGVAEDHGGAGARGGERPRRAPAEARDERRRDRRGVDEDERDGGRGHVDRRPLGQEHDEPRTVGAGVDGRHPAPRRAIAGDQ